MKLTICLSALLAISLYWNFALWNRDATPADKAKKPVPPVIEKLTALVDRLGPGMESRAEALREQGLTQEHAAATLVPDLNRRLRKRYMSRDDPMALLRAGKQAHSERRKILKELDAGDYRENVFDPHTIRLRFDFDPPRDEADKLKHRDSGRGFSSSSNNNIGPLPGDRGVHEVLSQVGGITLSQEQKAQLVEIARANHREPEARAVALAEAFDQETAAHLARCFEKGYRLAYQRATTVSDDLAVRVKFADALHEYVQRRDDPQRHERLLKALGEEGVEIVRAARW